MSLADLSDLAMLLEQRRVYIFQQNPFALGKLGSMHCPTCSEESTMEVFCIHIDASMFDLAIRPSERIPARSKNTKPMALQYQCVNCHARFSVFIYCGPERPEMAISPSKTGGLATPHTPELVAYYVNQAYLAQTVGAYSAAMSMYRTALDQILHSFGSDLHSRIEGLKESITNGTAPKWAKRLNPEALVLVKEIGDSQMHASESDREQAFEADFLHDIQVVFSYLLHKAYDEEKEREKSQDKVKNALKKP